ncbi:MAG TPA: DUF222 domain-containing protein [Acidimicrobiales bacterium]|nr:DUF222 domain-containing protein [Acidimicrobiales bacterium]
MAGGVLDELNEAIDGLDLPVDGDVLAGAFRLLDRLTAKVSEAAGAFDAAELWNGEGAASLASWLRVRAGLSNRAATRHASTARRLRDCPVTRRAWVDGALSGGQVQAVVVNVSDRTVPLYAEHEAALVPSLVSLDVPETAAAMRDWSARAEALLDERDPVEETGRAHLSPLMDGRGRLDADLTAEGYATARAALRVALDPKRDEDERTPPEKRHDALVSVFRFFLDHQSTHAAARHRPHLNVTVDLATLTDRTGVARLADEATVDAETALRLACDADVHRVITRGRSEVLDYGRATRVVAAALFAVLVLRDRGCRFPGCDRPPDRCDAHHVRHWIDGGPTNPGNLCLLCAYHHHVIHRPGWSLAMDADATIRVTDADGRCRSSRPPPGSTDAFAA